MKLDITAIILTKNEEMNIGDCIKSIIHRVKRIVIVDSYSDDKTIDIANEFGVEVFKNQYNYYAQQFNWGINNTSIKTEWILRLDADERFTNELWDEIEFKFNEIDKYTSGIAIEAWMYFLNKRIKHGLAKKRKIMLFKRDSGYIEDIKRDAHTIVKKGNVLSLKNRFIHKDFKSISDFIAKYNKYSTFETEDYLTKKHDSFNENYDSKISKTRRRKNGIYYKAPMFLRAHLWYVYNYYIKLGFLDGREGKIYHYLECYWYRFLVDAKIFENSIKKTKS